MMKWAVLLVLFATAAAAETITCTDGGTAIARKVELPRLVRVTHSGPTADASVVVCKTDRGMLCAQQLGPNLTFGGAAFETTTADALACIKVGPPGTTATVDVTIGE